MKYMGNKTVLLRGELGKLLARRAASSDRFIDCFAGSGAVAQFVSETTRTQVLSADLQQYSAELAGCIVERLRPLDTSTVVTSWTSKVSDGMQAHPDLPAWRKHSGSEDAESVTRAREWSAHSSEGFITRHYGGHYFSPVQAVALDRLFTALPAGGQQRRLGLAALLRTASGVAASPGHTAQPFQPTPKLLPYIRHAWDRDVVKECQKQIEFLSRRHANVKGRAVKRDAFSIARDAKPGDLVFLDPPYSAAQYSRFYHVLEGISIGGWPRVSGAGRSPAGQERASSLFSMKSTAGDAMRDLLALLRERECSVVITFPDAEASNGMSSDSILSAAKGDWRRRVTSVESVHSTLGGSSSEGGRGGRRRLKESVISLEPK